MDVRVPVVIPPVLPAVPASPPAHAGSATRAKVYDSFRGVYNWKQSNTRKMKAALGLGGYFGTARGSIGIFADSATEAQVGTSTWNQQFSWPIVMYNSLTAGGSAIQGGGPIPGGYNIFLGSSATNGIDPRVARTGTWVNSPSGYISSTVDASTLSYPALGTGSVPIVKVEGTAVSVTYEKQTAGGTFTVSIDDGTAASVNTAGTAGTYGTYTMPSLADTTHKVLITKTGTASVRIVSLSVYRSYGFMVHNMARSGSTAEEWGAMPAGGIHEHRYNGLTPAAVTGGGTMGAVIFSLGANDVNLNGRTAAQVKTYLQNLRNLWANPDVILVNYPQPQTPPAEWANLNQMYYDLADEWDCPLVDTFDMTGGWTIANGNGIMSSDLFHPNTRHQVAFGLRMASLIVS